MTIKEIFFHLNRILPLIGLPGWIAEADRILPTGETSCAIVEVDAVHRKLYTHWNLRHPDMTHSREDCLKNIYHEAAHAHLSTIGSITNNIIDTYVDVETILSVKKRVEDHVEILVGCLAVTFYNLIEKGNG
jgi:hypothetical protein